MTVFAREIAAHLDALLRTSAVPDYPSALNGLQFEHRGPVRKVAAAVDFCLQSIDEAASRGANLLLVHHGMYWGGVRPLVGAAQERLRRLLHHDIAVYASHLPLDAHPTLGNAALLARELALTPRLAFAHFERVAIGVAGDTDLDTAELISRADRFARAFGGTVRTSSVAPGRRSRRWAICTGAGASSDTLREARELGIDTLVVGEGPHHTAVEAPEQELVIIYAGHYATETLGVRATAEHLSRQFGLPWEFLLIPTGL